MAMNIVKTLRNNWKKSVFGAAVACYGLSRLKERLEINMLMRVACEEAARYGEARIHRDLNPKVVTVILNPVANKRAAKMDYEKYCEPILHLAGLEVELVTTTSEGHAKEIAERLHGTEAIVVAGGDGTLAETVTGLLRRNDNAKEFPLGVLPLGKTNTFGNKLFPTGEGIGKIKQLIDASMAVVTEKTEWKDVMKIEPIVPDEETKPRPIYALSSIEWGVFREAYVRKDKYWFTGPLRDYATYVFNGLKDSLTWNCNGTVKYTPPCTGCSNCIERSPQRKSKWSFFVPLAPVQRTDDYSKVVNAECGKTDEICFKTCEVKVVTPNVDTGGAGKIPSLKLMLGRNGLSYVEFVSEGWKRLKQEAKPSKVVEGRTFEILPLQTNSNEQIAIDSEEFDVKPMKITLLPKAVKLYCSNKV